MNSPVELLDVVDADDRVIDRAPRAEIHARGWRHRAVHVWLFNPAGQLFVQLRAASKDTFPRRFDSSASGHVDAGEDYDTCAVRELEEELGLQVSRADLDRHFKIDARAETGWEFVWVYSLRCAAAPRINPAEIAAGEFVDLEELGRRIAVAPQAFAPAFVHVFREWPRRASA